MSGSSTSGVEQARTPASNMVGKKGMATNGRGHLPLTYNNEPADDENMNEVVEENVDLNVLMPDGTTKLVTVEPNIPMMDLLVNLAASSRFNPSKHALCVLSSDRKKIVDYKAHQTVGSLTSPENRTVLLHIVPKKTEEEKKSKSSQPFEMTYRFTINLPHGQKKVIRTSPKTPLSELHQAICQEKHFDPACYIFQLPQNPEQHLGLELTLKDLDLKSNELDFVKLAIVDGGKSMQGMPRSSVSHTSYMPDTGEKKPKRSFLSFLGKKDKKFKLSDVAVDIDPGPAGGNKPIIRQKGTQQARPKTMIDTSSTSQEFMRMDINLKGSTNIDIVKENVAPLQSVTKAKEKKRPAPPPPQNKKSVPETVQVEISVESKTPHKDSPKRIEEISETKLPIWANKLHSRNSSDSSGYHELTLSGADSSPDKIDGDKFKGSFDSNSIDSEHLNGDSAIRDMSPPRRRVFVQKKSPQPASANTSRKSTESDDLEETGKKKKRAPLPPGSSSNVLSTSEKSLPSKPKSSDSSMHSSSSPFCKKTKSSTKTEVTLASSDEDEDNVLNSMEDVTAEFDNIIAEDEGMIMMEDASVRSEDMDAERVRSLRPCSFFAPPPPTEPPPPDSEPVDYNFAFSKWDRKDVGVGDDSTSVGAESAKSSPSSNVLEEMPEFHDKISKLSNDDDDLLNNPQMSPHEQSDRAQDSASQTSSFHEDSTEEEIKPLDIVKVEKVENEGSKVPASKEQEVSEITYSLMIDTIPQEFQNEEEPVDFHKCQDKEENSMNPLPAFSSPSMISDLETPKELGPSFMMAKKLSADKSSPREVELKEPEYSVPVPKIEQKQEKEEFIISLDDLNNIDFTGPKKKKLQIPVKKIEEPGESLSISSKTSYPYDHFDGTISKNAITYPEPDSYEKKDHGNDLEGNVEDDSVRNRCTELSFSPNSEGEMEHMLEEKSISQIALPAVRRTMDRQKSEEKASQNSSEPKLYSSSVKLVMSQSKEEEAIETEIENAEVQSEAEEHGMDTYQLINTQHSLLKQQFEMWQSQLLNNQKLLSSLESNDQSQQLRLQIQIQQNMMIQLQENMQALILQQQALPQTTSFNQSLPNSNIKQLNTASFPVVDLEPTSLALAVPEVPPVPPITPPLPSAHAYQTDAQFIKAPDSKDTKPNRPKRYEPELDPREKLMIAIRSFPGRNTLKKVPIQKTKWSANAK